MNQDFFPKNFLCTFVPLMLINFINKFTEDLPEDLMEQKNKILEVPTLSLVKIPNLQFQNIEIEYDGDSQ